MNNLTELAQWQALVDHQKAIAGQHMRDWFAENPERYTQFTLQVGEILLDYSRHRIQPETISLLFKLADAVQLREKIAGLFQGRLLNFTENRPALHTALRDQTHETILVNGTNIASLVTAAQQQMQEFCAKIQAREWRGATGKPIKHIVNIGIGGSYLGPMMCTYALKDFAISDLQFHFISSVDASHLNEILGQIELEATLFIVSSKSFSTLETMTNAATISRWCKEKLGPNAIKQHFIAITAQREKALAFGIHDAHIFPLWDWVGGRYSIWSTIGLPLMLMIGEKQFAEFLTGAFQIDQHFRHAEFKQNMPVLLALLSIWYMNFFDAKIQAVVPYAHRLRYLIPYLQQLDMESNGKNINSHGEHIHYATGPVIFGEEGCNGQHAYHQLLHQGQHLIPVDFILVGKKEQKDPHQDILLASGLSQAQALMRGKTYAEAYHELLAAHYSPDKAAQLAHHQIVPGNRPSNILFLERMSPKNLGALIALYEHKIFVQGAIWDINSFDQWGVELGKQLLPDILRNMQQQQVNQSLDAATAGFIKHFKKIQGA